MPALAFPSVSSSSPRTSALSFVSMSVPMPALAFPLVSSSSPEMLESATVSSGTTVVATTSTSSAGSVHSHNLWIIIATALALASLI